MNQLRRTSSILAAGPILFVTLAGCASNAPISAGDRVGVNFTCRQKSGVVAASSYAGVNDSAGAKSALFQKRGKGGAITLAAGPATAPAPAGKRKSFEEEIMARLAEALPGMRSGEGKTLEISSGRTAGLPQEEQFVKIARVWTQPKEVKMTLEKFKAMARKDAVVGDDFEIYHAVPGKVVEITGAEVLLRFAPRGGDAELPFGKGVVREQQDRYEIEIQAVKGTLVRTAGLAGRISEVDADFITLDYGHPLGGETLDCDLKVESVQAGTRTGDAGASLDLNIVQDLNKALATAAAGQTEQAAGLHAGLVQPGDLVTVNYTATTRDGALIATTLAGVANDPALTRAPGFKAPERYLPEEILAGKEELVPGLGGAVLGLGVGARKQIEVSPEMAFGRPDPQKLQQLPCARSFPRVIRMPADDYVKRFSSFPVLHGEVDLVPYFKARVTEVTERDVALEFLAKDGQSVSESYGKVSVGVAGDTVTTTLTPLLGAEFPVKEATGIISATDGTSFTVDTNHPLAGKEIVVDLEVVSLTKAATLPATVTDWIEDHEAGLALARKEGKPVFLMLYADWCGWCKKTMTETIPDPRLSRFKDKFVWVKINSDKETRYKAQYGQNGYPLMLVLNSDGTLRKRIDGYRDAPGLKADLEGVL